MRLSLLNTAALLALGAFCTLALADPPGLVGRVSSAQGRVAISGGAEDASGNLLNWPISSDSHVTTASGASAELRVGSATLRLDGDSELEVTQLDEDNFRLRLNYGSVSVRIQNPDMLRGFELQTAQVRVSLPLPGKVRVDTERAADTSVVSVTDGLAQVDGGSASLTVRAGRRAEIHNDDVRTGELVRDAFDNWPETPDPAPLALRYVSDDVTGYEQLDQYGSWSNDDQYGAVWQPSAVPAGWAPYRDGRWVWVDPWGWTWIDDLPWGYAPSHYGRWVFLHQRWGWAPGGVRGRQVWAPALVGWVGGDQWQVSSGAGGRRAPQPAGGWFPLSPRDRFVPGYRVSAQYEQRINAAHDAKWGSRVDEHARVDHRDGVTVLPHAQFGAPGTVTQAARASLPAGQLRNAPAAAPPVAGRTLGDYAPRRADQPLSWQGRQGQPQAAPGQAVAPGRRDIPVRNFQRPEPLQPSPLAVPRPAQEPRREGNRDRAGHAEERKP
ncbi:MAG TPA: DUF6600 domain-containing protein [Janthinobacterium sp.]|nr:DUF6600 domain-containing protein [Janthinobacterium sp.]